MLDVLVLLMVFAFPLGMMATCLWLLRGRRAERRQAIAARATAAPQRRSR